jgi:hypothetical protein
MAKEGGTSRSHSRQRVTAPHLILRLLVMVAALVAIDAAIGAYVHSGRQYDADWRLPRERSMSELGGLVNHIEGLPRDPAKPTVLFLGASPTWGEKNSDSHHADPAAFQSVARSHGVGARVFNLGANGELVSDQYFLAQALAPSADVVVVQLTYDLFNRRTRINGPMQYPELPRLLGDPVTHRVARILGIDATPSPNLIGNVNRFLNRYWTAFRENDALTTRLFGQSIKDELLMRWQKLTHTYVKEPPTEPAPRNVPFDDMDPGQQTVFVEDYADIAKFRLPPADSELRMLDLLCAELQWQHKRAAFYMSPVDVQILESFELFNRKQYDANVALVRRVVVSHGLVFIDFNQPKLVLPSGAFADMTHTTDHGSALFAARLYARIGRLLDAPAAKTAGAPAAKTAGGGS